MRRYSVALLGAMLVCSDIAIGSSVVAKLIVDKQLHITNQANRTLTTKIRSAITIRVNRKDV
ncbi:hypothetical protein GCM10008022_33090 [Paenibacillus hunanensis]|nr:hypothetical protein GCM10008022_33090 [Paenibacillus hunanensis]